jgi:glycosyltransferase involved in cell wall biosynthesis
MTPPPRLSIITAIHNGLPMNRFYWEMLTQQTRVPFELIVIDNHSTDGSGEFFAALGRCSLPRGQRVVHVRNSRNQSYPVSQNQGIQHARADILCFLNNDIWMPRGWHEPFEALLETEPHLVLSPACQEAQPTRRAACRLMRRWKRIVWFSTIWQRLLGRSEMARLQWMLEWMYGDLEQFQSPTAVRGSRTIPGINGSVVIFHRSLLRRLPNIWDERCQAADWYLYLTLAELHEHDPHLPLPQIVLDCYVHHFIRYTSRRRPEPFPIADCLPLRHRWSEAEIRRLWWAYHVPDA